MLHTQKKIIGFEAAYPLTSDNLRKSEIITNISPSQRFVKVNFQETCRFTLKLVIVIYHI